MKKSSLEPSRFCYCDTKKRESGLMTFCRTERKVKTMR